MMSAPDAHADVPMCPEHGRWYAHGCVNCMHPPEPVPAQEGRRHISDAAWDVIHRCYGLADAEVRETLEANHVSDGLVLLTVAEVEAMELRSRDREIQDCAIADLCAQVRDAEAERDTLRAQLAEREAECERLRSDRDLEKRMRKDWMDRATELEEEIERLRGGKDANTCDGSHLVGEAYSHCPAHPKAHPLVGTLATVAVNLDHRLGLGPQPTTETVEPMSATSWKRRMGG